MKRSRSTKRPSSLPPEIVAEDAYLRAIAEEKRKRGYDVQADTIEKMRKRRVKEVSEEKESRSIVRVDTARRGRPPLMEIHGAGTSPAEVKTPQILGAKIPGEPEILDKASHVEQPEPQIVEHERTVREGEGSIRSPKEDPSGPEVRVRSAPSEAWRRIKGGSNET
jgi:hypothetical protein